MAARSFGASSVASLAAPTKLWVKSGKRPRTALSGLTDSKVRAIAEQGCGLSSALPAELSHNEAVPIIVGRGRGSP